MACLSRATLKSAIDSAMDDLVDNTALACQQINTENIEGLWMMSGILHVTRNTMTNTNTWDWLNSGDHLSINVDSVSVDGSVITVDFPQTADRVSAFIVSVDSKLAILNETTTGTPYYGYGGFKAGAAIFLDRAEIKITQEANISARIYFDGTNWNASEAPPVVFSFSSTGVSYTYTSASGRLEIDTSNAFFIKNVPIVTPYGPNGTASSMFLPFVEIISSTVIHIYFWDMTNGVKLTGTAPTGLSFYISFGVVDCGVNPETLDFGPNADLMVMAIMQTNPA